MQKVAPQTVVEENLKTAPAPPMKHLMRASERRWDGLVTTLCGLTKQPKATSDPNTKKCEACLYARDFIDNLDNL